MTDPVIQVCGVTKRFRLVSPAASLKTTIIDLIKKRKHETFTALDDVSFTVGKGEVLGLIGANGSGKSTLLSIIAGTMHPTSGHVVTTGTISSLLELGAGFHPDLTGRENVMMYGSVMGISRKVMRKRFDAIVDFSGLDKFIDQPVRFYSSGMYVRLGFAVAVQVDPDILLIDEVLAVGDADFQRKCLDKMNEFKREGKSMLIISHDINTISSISDRIAYLDHGHLVGVGDPVHMAARYDADTKALRRNEWGTCEARISNVTLLDENGSACAESPTDGIIRVLLSWESPEQINTPTFGFSILDNAGRILFGSNTEIEKFDIPFIKGSGKLHLTIDASCLCSGNYMLSFSLHSQDHRINYHRLDNHIAICLDNKSRFDGIIRLPVKWDVPVSK